MRSPAVSGLVAAGVVVVSTVVAALAHEAFEPVDEAAIRRHITVLGADEMEGRAPGTPGGNRAADYLIDQLAAAGLRPFGDDGSFRQRVPLHGSTALPDSHLELWNLGEHRSLELGADYLLATAGSQTLIPRRAPMVFVGYGIVAPEFDYNDYRGVDVRGTAVVYLEGEPPSDDDRFFAGAERTVYAALETKERIALSRGAVGSLVIPIPRAGFADAWARTARDYGFESLDSATSLPEHLCAILHPGVAEWLFSDALYDFTTVLELAAANTLRSFHLPTEIAFHGRFRMRDALGWNLVGLVDGGDPELRDSFLVVVAHYDHLGIGPEIDGDAIYNGVVDNALGVACVVEIAGDLAAARGPPRRSVIVLLTTAEEAGLLGARTFLDRASIPPSRMIAAVNVDGLAFLNRFNDLVAIGGGLSDLGSRLAWAVKPLGLRVTRPPDGVWSHAAYARGDQLAFAERGVPSILILEGFDWPGMDRDQALDEALAWMRERYHSPRDDLHQPLDLAAAAAHCTAIRRVVRQLADAPTEPEWYPGSPYAYERLLSLAVDR